MVNRVFCLFEKIDRVGKVFLAREKESKKDVAIKVMFLPHFCERGIQDQLRDEIQVKCVVVKSMIDPLAPNSQSYYACLWMLFRQRPR